MRLGVQPSLTHSLPCRKIRANISLESTKKWNASFKLFVPPAVINEPMVVDLVSTPLNSIVQLQAMRTYAVTVKLPTTYEGSFDASTLHDWVAVHVDRKAKDPSEEGRRRMWLVLRPLWNRARGHVRWFPGGVARGTVSVKSSVALVTLEL